MKVENNKFWFYGSQSGDSFTSSNQCIRKKVLSMTASRLVRAFPASATSVAFPLGGIGTGNISLGARGELRDWEIFNHASKGTQLPNTFFAIRVQGGNQVPVLRVLEGPMQPPHLLSHGYWPWTGAGLPRFASATFRGEYPFATIEFEDPSMPVLVRLEAFTPLIPLNPDDSGLPCAVLTYTVTNTAITPMHITIVGSLINPVGGVGFDRSGNLAGEDVGQDIGQNINEYRDEPGLRGLFLHSLQFSPEDLRYGSLGLSTNHPEVTVKRTWLRGAWYDYLQEFWDDFSADGKLEDHSYETPSDMGKTDTGSLGLVDTLAPGTTKAYRFVLTWFFPNRTNSWDNKPSASLIRNHYATHFTDAWEVARYVVDQFPRLEKETRRFHAALFGSTLPTPVLDAISANIVPIRSNTCFWLEDGRFYGFEGCFDNGGCCEGTCTHVWSYAQTLAFLFPSLEREMRRIEFVIETESDGYMSFRTYKLFGETFVWPWGDQKAEAAVDGQMGSILRVYREWLFSADRSWLESVWPGVKRAIAFATAHWDTDGDGVLDGRQHNTYDIEFFGPNPLCGIYYLAGLRAVAALAEEMGEPDLAEYMRQAAVRGSQNLDALLWNGEYYVQCLDDVNAHKYQHGLGCLADQLLGQLHARILGLGDLVPIEHVRMALRSIYTYNFKHDFREHVNCQRTFVLNDEAGLVLCTWPHGGRPHFPFVYSDEVWTGVEYQVAAHLIYEGWISEGLAIVEAVRDRHDGIRRNPWNEVECGHHYARSMASWALLLALSGFHYNCSKDYISFAPVIIAKDFHCFFITGKGWGSFIQKTTDHQFSASLVLQYGNLHLLRIGLKPSKVPLSVNVKVEGRSLPARIENSGSEVVVVMEHELVLSEGETLQLSLIY